MKQILTYILNRLKERSTWLGLVGVLASAGVQLQPDQSDAIAALGVALVGFVYAVFPELGATPQAPVITEKKDDVANQS